ncbi:MAG: DUF2125 domain-containing protein [Hyphomicrobiales bacterium]
MLLILLFLVVLIGAVWSGLWYFAANWAEAAIAEAMAREAQAGRMISCASREISGFPFRMLVRCDQAKLAVTRPEGVVTIALPRLRGVAQISDPRHVLIEAQSPLSIEVPGKPSIEIEWRSLAASLVPPIGGIGQGEVTVEAPILHLREGQSMISSSADRLELQARRDPQNQDDAVAVTATLSRLVSPLLDALSGDADPADIAVEASISAVAALQPQAREQPAPLLERWRLAGGVLHLTRLTAIKGPLKAGLAGDLALDELHRATGRIDASLEGGEALLPRLGLPAAAGGLLRLGSGRLRLPIALTNGRVSVGPFSVARLLPLY